ncbi:hypothetical protein D3C72_1009110 [compost metagenome]
MILTLVFPCVFVVPTSNSCPKVFLYTPVVASGVVLIEESETYFVPSIGNPVTLSLLLIFSLNLGILLISKYILK